MKTWTIILVSFLLPPAVKDDSKRGRYRDKIKDYMDRAEQIKAHVNQMKEGNGATASAKAGLNCCGARMSCRPH